MSVKGHYPDRTSQLPQFQNIKLPEHANHVYSVELIHTGHDKDNKESHSSVSGILNSLAPRAIETQRLTGPVRAVLIDVIKPELETYSKKLDLLKKVEEKVGKPNVMFVPEIVTGHKEVKKLIDKTKQAGHEGVIVTSASLSEDRNPRIKIKHYKTYNLKVSKINQEIDIHGKPKNSMGSMSLIDATGRHVGDVGGGFSRAMREAIWKDPNAWEGRVVQVRAMDPQAHKIRFPIYNGLADGELDTV